MLFASWLPLGSIGRSSVGTILVVLTVLDGALLAQTPSPQSPLRPAYLDQRFDENWSFLRDPARLSDVWDSWKFIPIGASENAYVSIGGEARERWDFFREASFGAV